MTTMTSKLFLELLTMACDAGHGREVNAFPISIDVEDWAWDLERAGLEWDDETIAVRVDLDGKVTGKTIEGRWLFVATDITITWTDSPRYRSSIYGGATADHVALSLCRRLVTGQRAYSYCRGEGGMGARYNQDLPTSGPLAELIARLLKAFPPPRP